MGYILEMATRQRHPLRAHHTFGRGVEQVDTPVSDSRISRIHAALEWNGEHWCVRDLSRNGTWRNGMRLIAAESALLAVGDLLCFGDTDGPEGQPLSGRCLMFGAAVPSLTPIMMNPNLQIVQILKITTKYLRI